MSHRAFDSMTASMAATAMAAVVAVVSLAPVPAAGQAPTAAATTWDPPRTAGGQPDLQGFWIDRYWVEPEPKTGVMGLYSIEEGVQEEHAKITGQSTGGASMVVDPPDGKVPYQPWAAARRQEYRDNYNNATEPWHIDPVARCWLEGTRNFYQSVFQIVQTPGQVVVLFEYQHAYRIIPLDGRPHIGETIKLFMGDSRGHWEGDTLVVDVTSNNDLTWFDAIGTFHSNAMHVLERFTFVDADTLYYEATIEDPKVFTRPWTMAVTFVRNKEPDFELMEDACYEGERSTDRMLLRR